MLRGRAVLMAVAQLKTTTLREPPTELETRIFDLLLAVNDRFGLGATLRVAGGWVRDKMLGKSCKDMDIALEGTVDGKPMTGEVFGGYVTQYQEEHGMEKRHVGTIKANPDQSKHLETATTHIFGEAIDLVHLRTEDYTHTRIPTVRPGTVEEDAMRRDLSINAMYYNLHTKLVEDYTGGLADLAAGIIRTPLPPRTTFEDDPLRLLRCVRFSCTLGFKINPDIVECARDPVIHQHLDKKVSRERVGIEVNKMLSGMSPMKALETFLDFNLVTIVFQEETGPKKKKKDSTAELKPVDWGEDLVLYKTGMEIVRRILPRSDEEDRNWLILGALLLPLSRSKGWEPGPGFKPHQGLVDFVTSVIVLGLKLPKKVAERVQLLITCTLACTPLWETGLRSVETTEDMQQKFTSALRPARDCGLDTLGDQPSPRLTLARLMK
eukprot:Sspe_Gene.103726::Locus_79576_Transcript_1_1_Confidence_1.000_Length_1331::g.103726::m.103726